MRWLRTTSVLHTSLTLVLLTLVRSEQMPQTVLFVGDSFLREFQGSSSIKLNSTQLSTVNKTHGFYIEDKGDTIYMKNDGVEMDDTTQMAQFTITVSYPSKGDYSITFKVIWGVATKDFKLEAGVRDFSLVCEPSTESGAEAVRWIYNTGNLSNPIWVEVKDHSSRQASVTSQKKERQQTITFNNTGLESIVYKNPEPLTAYAGEYACEITFSNNEVGYRYTYIFSQPYLWIEPTREHYLTEQSLEIECKVLGWPPPTIEWFFGLRKMYTKEEDIKMKKVDATASSHITLETTKMNKDNSNILISKLNLRDIHINDHRGNFQCRASNEYDETSSVLQLRIRDKNAWIIPLLGIFIQIFIIFTCVMMCPNKKVRRHEKAIPPTIKMLPPSADMMVIVNESKKSQVSTVGSNIPTAAQRKALARCYSQESLHKNIHLDKTMASSKHSDPVITFKFGKSRQNRATESFESANELLGHLGTIGSDDSGVDWVETKLNNPTVHKT